MRARYRKARSPPTGKYAKIALLDVNLIFKEHATFKDEMANLKKEADELDKKLKEQQGLLAVMATQLKELTAGSKEYNELEEKITRYKTDQTIEMQTKRREVYQRESNIYRLTYREIESDVEKYCREHQIDMVIRFVGNPVDSNNPESVLANINKPIVWFNDKLDITSAIIRIITEKQKQLPKEEKGK